MQIIGAEHFDIWFPLKGLQQRLQCKARIETREDQLTAQIQIIFMGYFEVVFILIKIFGGSASLFL